MSRHETHRNREGYYDNTAGAAIGRADAERRKQMGQTRKCRLSDDDKKIHDWATKKRKMTDRQLYDYVNDRVEKAKAEGYNKGKKYADAHAPEPDPKQNVDYESLLDKISKINGIGIGSVNKIRKLLIKEGLLSE